ELMMVRPVVLHRAALLVHDRQHAVDIWKSVQHTPGSQALGDVFARARRAVHGADDREVVARAVAQVLGSIRSPFVPHEEARLERASGVSLGRNFTAKSVIALESVGADVVDMDVIARRNIAGREADDLAVLQDGLARADRGERDLVAHADTTLE